MSVSPIACPIAGSVQSPIALRMKIAPVATAMLELLAPIAAPMATIAEPPQIAVPEVMSVEISRPVRSSFPRRSPMMIAPTMVPMASATPLPADFARSLRSSRNPRRTTHA